MTKPQYGVPGRFVECPRCHVTKEFTEANFYFNKSVRRPGKVNCGGYCRVCHRKRQAEHCRTPQGIAQNREAQARFVAKNPHIVKAKSFVGTELGAGRLTRLPCEICGTVDRVQAHHWLGYARENWVKVKWLCQAHHQSADAYLNDVERGNGLITNPTTLQAIYGEWFAKQTQPPAAMAAD